jgi:hypothetical protein
MPLKIATTNIFLKEVERAKKRGKDLAKLKDVLRKLANGEN